MELKYLIYEIIKKNKGNKITDVEISDKLNKPYKFLRDIILKLSLHYPNIKVEEKLGVRRYYYENQKDVSKKDS